MLHFSQPAVSQQILSLEKYLGQRLFERKGRTLELTVAGMRFVVYARSLLRDTEAMMADVRGVSDTIQGVITIGAIDSAGVYQLPGLISAFQAEYPSVRVNMKVVPPEYLIGELLRGELDFALLDIELPVFDKGSILSDLFETEEYTLALPPDHPWQERQDVTPDELYEMELILPVNSTPQREQLERDFSKMGIDTEALLISMEIGGYESVRQSVQAGLGIAFLPNMTIAPWLGKGYLAQARLSQALERHLWLYTNGNNCRHLRVETFRRYLLEHAKTVV
jgi:DNA-binding transcriptional LysR family regulator